MSKPKTYTLHHRNYRNQDVYDPCGGSSILRVDAAGRLRGLSREQASALLRSPAWSMEGGAEALAFEAAAVDLSIKLSGLRDVVNAFRETTRGALAVEGPDALQRTFTRELALRGLPDIDLAMIVEHGMFNADPAEIPPEPDGDEGEGDEDDDAPDAPSDGLSDEDKRFVGEIDPTVLDAAAGADGDAEAPEPETRPQPERRIAPLDATEVEALHKTLAEMPWRGRVAIAEAMGETITGAGASARALEWLQAQPPEAVGEAMQNLKIGE